LGKGKGKEKGKEKEKERNGGEEGAEKWGGETTDYNVSIMRIIGYKIFIPG